MKTTEDARGDTYSEYYQRKACASHEQCWEFVLDIYHNLAKGSQFLLVWEDRILPKIMFLGDCLQDLKSQTDPG